MLVAAHLDNTIKWKRISLDTTYLTVAKMASRFPINSYAHDHNVIQTHQAGESNREMAWEIASLARKIRERTVPIGQPSAAAISS